MSRWFAAVVSVGALLALLASAETGFGQETPVNPVREARRLHDAGEHENAELYLRAYLEGRPGDPAALRLLASVLEAAADLEGAREAYEAVLRAGPNDPLLRLDYGRVLVELGEEENAREVLGPVARDPSAPPGVRADAWVQLGRIGRRVGSRDTAEVRFRRALELDARHPEALRLLRALHRERAPWIGVEGGFGEDDQPVHGYAGTLKGGVELFPWLSSELEAGARRLGAGDVDETLTSARATLSGRWELLNLEASVWGGGFRRSEAEGGDWSGGATLAYRGPADAWIEFEVGRAPYVLTAASLEAPVTVVTLGGTVGRPDAEGWAGALAYREDRFPDHEPVEEAEAWIRAPVVRDPAGIVRLGYRFHAAQSAETAFVPLVPRQLDRQGRVLGRYAPIYTPRELRSHSLLLDARHSQDGGTTLSFDGSWGFDAEEEAPVLFPAVPGAPEAGTDLQHRRRSFTPWHARIAARFPVTGRLLLDVSAGYRRTAFRGHSSFQIAWTFYDLPEELR